MSLVRKNFPEKAETIYTAQKNKNYVICHIPNNIPNISLLKNLGIRKDSQIFKKHTYRLGGPVLVSVDLREIALGKDIAEQIIVKEA